MNAKTRTGQKVVAYLREHPDETSPTRISKATGCHRDTARQYLEAQQAARLRQTGAEPAPTTPAETGAPGPRAAPPVEPAKPAPKSAGHDFQREFPPSPAPPKPVPQPAPKPAPQPAPDDDDFDEVVW